MMAHELRGAISEMDRKEGRGKSGFENQFQVLDLLIVFNMKPSGVAIESKSCNKTAVSAGYYKLLYRTNCFSSIIFHSTSSVSF